MKRTVEWSRREDGAEWKIMNRAEEWSGMWSGWSKTVQSGEEKRSRMEWRRFSRMKRGMEQHEMHASFNLVAQMRRQIEEKRRESYEQNEWSGMWSRIMDEAKRSRKEKRRGVE
jgi:hypothetical protein